MVIERRLFRERIAPAGSCGERRGGDNGSVQVVIAFAAQLRLFLASRHRTGGSRQAFTAPRRSATWSSPSASAARSRRAPVSGRGRSHRPAGLLMDDHVEVFRFTAADRAGPPRLPARRPPRHRRAPAAARRGRRRVRQRPRRRHVDRDGQRPAAGLDSTQDRGLLRRRKLWFGAFVRGSRPTTSSPICSTGSRRRWRPGPAAPLQRGARAGRQGDIGHRLEPGLAGAHDMFARCETCATSTGRARTIERLETIVNDALAQTPPARGASAAELHVRSGDPQRDALG